MVLLLAASGPAFATEVERVADLADYSLEQLANVKVTTVSRREESLLDAPASVFVITAEDIRRAEVEDIAPRWRSACQYIVRDQDILVKFSGAPGGA